MWYGNKLEFDVRISACLYLCVFLMQRCNVKSQAFASIVSYMLIFNNHTVLLRSLGKPAKPYKFPIFQYACLNTSLKAPERATASFLGSHKKTDE